MYIQGKQDTSKSRILAGESDDRRVSVHIVYSYSSYSYTKSRLHSQIVM